MPSVFEKISLLCLKTVIASFVEDALEVGAHFTQGLLQSPLTDTGHITNGQTSAFSGELDMPITQEEITYR